MDKQSSQLLDIIIKTHEKLFSKVIVIWNNESKSFNKNTLSFVYKFFCTIPIIFLICLWWRFKHLRKFSDILKKFNSFERKSILKMKFMFHFDILKGKTGSNKFIISKTYISETVILVIHIMTLTAKVLKMFALN
jgi:hypothetical protein